MNDEELYVKYDISPQTQRTHVDSACADQTGQIGRRVSERKFVGFRSDGASAVLGVNNSVPAKLKEFCPSLVSVWCVAHRLELHNQTQPPSD